jgi:hypothetical protein
MRRDRLYHDVACHWRSDVLFRGRLSALLGGTIFEALFTATCGALVTGLTAGAGAPLAELGCFYAGSFAAGWVGYEAGG